jgi:PIN like domain
LRALAAIAEADGHQVEAKFDKFDGNTSVPDTEWLGLLGNEGGWAFVSDDHRIYRNPQERSACSRPE